MWATHLHLITECSVLDASHRRNQTTAAIYPYTAKTDACSTTILSKTTSTQVVRPSAGPSYVSAAKSQSALMAAVQKQPVAVSFYAAFNAFYYYTSGVLSAAGCPTTSDHAVLLIGECPLLL